MTRRDHPEAGLSHYPPGEEPPKRLLEEGSIWIVVAGPVIWAAHFLLCYWAAAVWCAKIAPAAGGIGPVRAAVGGLTVVALALIALIARLAVRRYHGVLVIDEAITDDTEGGRTRFMGHATLLLCALSATAVLFDALPALVFRTCGG